MCVCVWERGGKIEQKVERVKWRELVRAIWTSGEKGRRKIKFKNPLSEISV